MSRPLLLLAQSQICCIPSRRLGGAAIRAFSKKRAVSVVLLQDLGARGFMGDEVIVKPGFARNHLIPSKKAVYATPNNQTQHIIEKTEEERRLLEERRDFLMLKERTLTRVVSCIRAVTTEGETLEKPVTLDELVSMVKKQLKHPTVTKDRLKLAKGSEIKSLGESMVQLKVDVPELLKAHPDYADKDVETLEVKVEVRRDETKKVVRKDDGPAEEAQQ